MAETELIKTNAESPALTADTSKDYSLHNASSIQGTSIEWTDEKHRLYIDSLEASFVTQLHHSIASRGCLQNSLWGPYSSQTLPKYSCNSSNQFMVLQDGSLKKSNSKRNKSLLEDSADSHFIQKGIWIHHFSSSRKQCISGCHDRDHGASSIERIHSGRSFPVCCGSTRYSEQHPLAYSLYHQSSVGIDIEVSDQNFVNEDQEEKSRSMNRVKRLKVVKVDSSSNDQIVPFANYKINNVSTACQASSEREELAHLQFLPENPDLHYFLRES